MPIAQEKKLRQNRIMHFIQENRDMIPVIPAPAKQEDLLGERKKKHVTFHKTKKQTSWEGRSPTPKLRAPERKIGMGLTSCLITRPSDTRIAGGANNPGERAVGKLPRTDSECRLKSPVCFPKSNENVGYQNLKFIPSRPTHEELKNKRDMFPKVHANTLFKDQTTQTLYRESSAQTLAYLPEVTEPEAARNFEVFSLAKLLPGDKPPGLQEVEVLERSRRRWVFRDALKRNFQAAISEVRKMDIQSKYKGILEAFEWEQWIEREEYIQDCQMMRLEIVIKMFDKREKEMHDASNLKLEKACKRIEKKRQAGLRKNEIEYQRGMRRVNFQFAKKARRWKKEDPLESISSYSSELYAPLTRHGVDPARRNFTPTTGHKAFDMRIDDLEKRVNMKNLKCPFSKLNEWSKPKEYVREYEQNFCNDGNLLRLYESLKTLRTQKDMEKEAPKCLRIKHQPIDDRRARQSYFPLLFHSDRPAGERKSSMAASNPRESGLSPEACDAKQNIIRKQLDLENFLITHEASSIGWIMQFLSDEMDRLRHQRELHFFSILAQKERWRREAEEAGLRQKENYLRLIYDGMFQNCNGFSSDVSDEYIKSILATDMRNIAENEARETVTQQAREMDAEIDRRLDNIKLVQNPLTFVPLRLMLKEMVCPDLEAALRQHETHLITQYIVEDVLFSRVWRELEPFDVANTLTSDLIDRLIDNDLYLFSSDSESDTPQKTSWKEGHAIIRKLIRQAVPGRRWNEENEVIGSQAFKDIFDDIFEAIIQRMDSPVDPIQRNTIECVSSEASSSYESDILKSHLLSLIRHHKTDITGVLQSYDEPGESSDPDRIDKVTRNEHNAIMDEILGLMDLPEHGENFTELDSRTSVFSSSQPSIPVLDCDT